MGQCGAQAKVGIPEAFDWPDGSYFHPNFSATNLAQEQNGPAVLTGSD